MHVVIWTAAGQHYATRTRSVVEVIPAVQARPIPGADSWVKGLMDYRGQLIPLIEASALLGQDATEPRMASRILVVEAGGKESGKLCGLLVTAVLGSEFLEFEGRAAHESSISGVDFLGPVALTPTGTVQLTEPDRITVSA